MMQPHENIIQLPEEVWKIVVGYLEHEDLLTGRLVCKTWKQFVDDCFQDKIWRPYFPQSRQADILSKFSWKIQGTRFSTAEEIEEFIAEHDKSKNENPIAKQTLILNCRSNQQYTQVCEKFPMLVQRFGSHVCHCVYFVQTEVPASVRNIPLILTMKNLQTLTIYCAKWNNDKKGDLDPFPTPALKQFKNLNIFGDRINEGSTVIKTVLAAYKNQIKRLKVWGFASGISAPNVEDLKISDAIIHPTNALTCPLGHRPFLKRLSLKISQRAETIDLRCLFTSWREFGGTLESIHLQVNEKQLTSCSSLGDISFPKVTDLRVPLYFPRWSSTNIGNLSVIFPQVNHLQLANLEALSEDWLAYKRVIDGTVDTVWSYIEGGIQTISVRNLQGHLGQSNNNRVVFKYSRVTT